MCLPSSRVGRRFLCGDLAGRRGSASPEARRGAAAPRAAWQRSVSPCEGDVISSRCGPGLRGCSPRVPCEGHAGVPGPWAGATCVACRGRRLPRAATLQRSKPVCGCPPCSFRPSAAGSIWQSWREGISMQVGTHSHGAGRPGNARSLAGRGPGAQGPWPRRHPGRERARGSVGFGAGVSWGPGPCSLAAPALLAEGRGGGTVCPVAAWEGSASSSAP